jgi:hypothetical protein
MGLSLPTIAVGVFGSGRLLFVGRYTVLTACRPNDAEMTLFLESICRYCGGEGRGTYRILLLAWPPHAAAPLLSCLSSMDMLAELSQTVADLTRFNMVITTTECTEIGALDDFLAGDTGVIVCGIGCDDEVAMPMRKLLEKFGVGIPLCSALVGDPTVGRSGSRVRVSKKYCLPSLIRKFIKKVDNPETHDPNTIDHLTAELRYHLSALPGHAYPELTDLSTACWALLDSTCEADVVCPQVLQCIVAVLLIELLGKLPPSCFAGMDRGRVFPGPCRLETESFRARIRVGGDCWVSTGVYLIPGTVATVQVSHALPHCFLQGGAHLPTVVGRSGPWKRYPAVTVRVPLENTTVEICSPFGGILYIVAEGAEDVRVDVTFCNVGRHPFFSRGDPALWEQTRALPAPWAEVETCFIIFTLPTSFLITLEQPDAACQHIDDLVRMALEFMQDETFAPYRVVFDVEVSAAARRVFYPLILPIENARPIFLCEQPSEALIQFLHHIALRSLRPGSFPTNAREALAALTAYVVASAAWPEQESHIKDMVNSPSPLFNAFFRIYASSDKRLFPSTLSAVRPRISGSAGKGHMVYGFFVKKLSLGCGSDLSQSLLEGSVTATRPDVGAELGASEDLDDYHLDPWENESPM